MLICKLMQRVYKVTDTKCCLLKKQSTQLYAPHTHYSEHLMTLVHGDTLMITEHCGREGTLRSRMWPIGSSPSFLKGVK